MDLVDGEDPYLNQGFQDRLSSSTDKCPMVTTPVLALRVSFHPTPLKPTMAECRCLR